MAHMRQINCIATAALSVFLLSGCITETVDKSPPKIGQTVERPSPAAEQSQENANQVQADTSGSTTVVPGGATATSSSSNQSNQTAGGTTSIFPGSGTGAATANGPGTNTQATPPATNTPPANSPETSPLMPTGTSSAPIKDGGG